MKNAKQLNAYATASSPSSRSAAKPNVLARETTHRNGETPLQIAVAAEKTNAQKGPCPPSFHSGGTAFAHFLRSVLSAHASLACQAVVF